ncbi:hypothetical protein QJV03_12140 [Listeria swaminathanii]|uniref:Uncharacterized protein n=1 Tax=Listeria swaminathanii TaxID=2713501 RepID=A0ABU2IHV2_9LIST|nr:hypothetical protein [Listeria swaminathanii]MDT0017936.1 hypothetical protein [Listeria swaminathanii]MDT0023563.1 hypothetical protein [Listeria swaminathanii]MDT0034445.1 hypothetical protein [Listeria swaminathanii]MDT0053327.1 hypothetical protein [Listeria swaminathanii]MDT0056093.1 hypothetical protein [Listeria swaminathanii]
MCQKLQTFLTENKANLLLKYDSVRKNNKYTFMLFDTEKNERIFGGDTNSIIETEQSFINNAEINLDFVDVNELFFKIKNAVKLNTADVVLLSINYSDRSLKYSVYIDNEKDSSHNVFLSYKELKDFVEREI